jgi:hypothetical protein
MDQYMDIACQLPILAEEIPEILDCDIIPAGENPLESDLIVYTPLNSLFDD